jgi:hypothetical protein
MKKLLTSFLIAFMVLPVSICLAIANPDNIDFGTGTTPLYKVFENVLEDGDMLFIAEGYVNYAVEPTDYEASEAFLFEVIDTDGETTLLSRPIEEYGDRPISIYKTANQTAELGLVSGSAYILRITGNPLIFATPTGNSDNVTLTSEDYIDQSTMTDNVTPTGNYLRNFCILMVKNIQEEDSPTDDYYTSVQGYSYLTSDGADIFVQGVPNLYNMCPILFQYGSETMESDAPESTGTYALTLTPLQKWGATTADGLTNLGVFLGINQALAGSVVFLVLVMMLAVYVYSRTQSGVTVLIIVSSMPFIGGFMGLVPMVMAFIFVILTTILMGYYFLSRGAL